MGIDRHELEHRNWRSTAPAQSKDLSRDVADDPASLVPGDSTQESETPVPPAKPRAKRAKAD